MMNVDIREYTANGKREVQVDNFLNEHRKTVQKILMDKKN